MYSRKDTLRITWDAAFKDEFSLIIVDNQGNEIRVVDAVVAGQIECLTDLPEGLYYWKLVGRKEMWGVGRIKVRNSEE